MPAPFFLCEAQGRAPLQCTNTRHQAQASPLAQPTQLQKSRTENTPKPRIPGLCALCRNFLAQTRHSGTRPAITLSLPSFGDLGTGRPRIPSLIPGALDADSVVPHTRFGNLGTGRPGIPSLIRSGFTPFWEPWYRQAGNSLLYTRGLCGTAPIAPARFGNLGTGRPGIPSFILRADGSAAASGHRPSPPTTPPATAAPPPG